MSARTRLEQGLGDSDPLPMQGQSCRPGGSRMRLLARTTRQDSPCPHTLPRSGAKSGLHHATQSYGGKDDYALRSTLRHHRYRVLFRGRGGLCGEGCEGPQFFRRAGRRIRIQFIDGDGLDAALFKNLVCIRGILPLTLMPWRCGATTKNPRHHRLGGRWLPVQSRQRRPQPY